MTKIVDYNSYTGVTETFHKDAMSGVIKIHQSKDLDPLLKQNAIERNSAQSGFKGETFHKMASVDLIVIDMWRQELKDKGYDNYDPLAKENKIWLIAKLNSRDYQKLRTKEGTI